MMKYFKLLAAASGILLLTLLTTGCENTQVGGSISYGMGTGYGYPMYYGHHHHHHSDVVVVRPPKKERPRPRPSKPKTRPMRNKRR